MIAVFFFFALMSDLDDLESKLASTFGGASLSFGTPGGVFDATTEEAPLPPVELGQELALIHNPSEVCLGKVGGTKVCLKLANECFAKTHSEKAEAVFTKCMLVRTGKMHAFIEPRLPTFNLRSQLLQSL